MMRRIILLLVLLFFANLSYSQKVFRKGIIVKGKEVTYQVLASKQASFYYLVRNVNNPDTTLKPIPQRSVYTAQERDMELQIAEIVHENLSPGELDSLKFDGDFAVVLRVNREEHRLLQVTCFMFCGGIIPEIKPEDAFWLNFDPDRLHKIEREIVEKVVLPAKIHESYLIDDFVLYLGDYEIREDIDKMREKRKEVVESWMEDRRGVDWEMLMFGPPREL